MTIVSRSLCICIMRISVCVDCITLCETEAERTKAIRKKREETTACIISELISGILYAALRSDM